MERRLRLFACVAAACLALGACSTNSVVATTSVDEQLTATNLGARTAYLPYFLPQSVFVVSMKKSSGGGDDNKKDAAPTVNNTINIQGGAVSTKPAATKPDGGGDKKPACDVLKAAYNTARDEQTNFYAVWENRKRVLQNIAYGPLNTPKLKKAARTAYDALAKDIAASNDRVEEAKRLADRLEQACPEKISIEVTMEVMPDTSKTYMLLFEDSDVSADKLTAKTDDRGLLTSISTTADDKTGETLIAAVKSLGTLAGALSPADLSGIGGMRLPPPLPPAGAALVAGVDPFPEEFKRKVEDLIKLKPPALLPELGVKLPQHPLRITLSELLPSLDTPRRDNSDINRGWRQLAGTKYGLHVACSPLPGDLTPNDPNPKPSRGTNERREAKSGALMALPRSCDVVVGEYGSDMNRPADYQNQQRSFVTVVDSRAPVQAPLLRSRFVSRTNSYEFKDGRVVSVTYDKPSTSAAVWALPGSLVGGLFSGLVAGIVGPQSVVRAQADYLDAQAAVYTAQAALIDAQIKAKEAEDKLKPSAPPPLDPAPAEVPAT